MIQTQIDHATSNPLSPIFDGQNTYVPPFQPGIKPDYVLLIGGGLSTVTFENALLKIVDRIGRQQNFEFARITPESVEAEVYRAAVAQVVSHVLVPSAAFSSGKIGLIIRRYLPGVKDQAPQEMPYFVYINAGTTYSDTDILTMLAAKINADPNRIVNATITSVSSSSSTSSTVISTTSTTIQPSIPQLNITSITPGDFFESIHGVRLSKQRVDVPNVKLQFDGSYLQTITGNLTAADYATTKQYRGIKFSAHELFTFAGAGAFRGGRAENNARLFRKITAWIIAETTDADGTTKLNAALAVLKGNATAKNYYTLTAIADFA